MDLDEMLKQLGQLSRFQCFSLFLLMFPVMMSGFASEEYVMVTMNIPHRCRVPECDGPAGSEEFAPPWLPIAVPLTSEQEPEPCLRYRTLRNLSAECSAELFDTRVTDQCGEWVFQEAARTVAHDFQLLCPKDEWKLTALGSYGVLTLTLGLPVAGILSDRFGRKFVLLIGALVTPVVELWRSYISSYETFVVSQLLLGFFGEMAFVPGYILGLEMLPSQQRVLVATLISIFNSLGIVSVGLLMWWFQDWRMLLRASALVVFAAAGIFWLLPESVRWLYAKKRFTEVEVILSSIAEVNGTTDKLPAVLEELRSKAASQEPMQPIETGRNQSTRDAKTSDKSRLVQMLKSRVMLSRIIICCLYWIAMEFLYHGFTLNSVAIGGSRYVNFVLSTLIEIPASFAGLWLCTRPSLGRRRTMASSFFLGAAACGAFLLVDKDRQVVISLLALAGKFCAAITIDMGYLHTAELFPTELRTSLLTVCSTSGRIGNFLVPQLPLLAAVVDPMLVFGLVSVVGGVLVLFLPETLNTRLPDTLQEAEDMGSTTRESIH